TLGATIIEVELPDIANAKRAQTALCKFGMCDVEADGHTVQLKVTDGSRAAIDVVRALDREGFEPVGLALREPTLDDVFLSLTGNGAEEPESDDESASGRSRDARGAA